MCRRTWSATRWQRALAAEERVVDVPFAVKLPGNGGPPCMLHGVIDLAFKTAAGWELVDHKTDQVEIETLIERYGDQVRIYATHWAGLAAGLVTYAGLYSVRDGATTPNLTGD